MTVSDLPLTSLERRLVIAEARKWLATDPSDGVGHAGLPRNDPGMGGPDGEAHAGVGRDGGGSSASPDGPRQARALAERILAILGER